MLKSLLLRHVTNLQRPTLGAVYVLLWDYFTRSGLREAENLIRRQGGDSFELEPYPTNGGHPSHVQAALAELGSLRRSPAEFDLLALRWLKGLDQSLESRRDKIYDRATLPGLDGSTYWLRRRDNLIAEHFADQPSGPIAPAAEAGDSLSLFPYCLQLMAVPTGEISGRSIDAREARKWATPALHLRLMKEREEGRFSVLLWPLHTEISYVGVDLEAPLLDPTGMNYTRLAAIENEDELLVEVLQAVRVAREKKATILILPELALSPAVVAALRQDLSKSGAGSWPLLTLAGTCHCSLPDHEGDLNEALLLGPDGTVLHRHRKLENFVHKVGPGRIGERLQTGASVTVLESAIGNLVPLICLDHFHDSMREILRRCHGNLFLVPSLSPKTSAHRRAAADYQRQRLVSSFVCNRWLIAPKGAMEAVRQASFILLGRREDPEVQHTLPLRVSGSSTTSEPYLYFVLT
jgi:hypothetical protein